MPAQQHGQGLYEEGKVIFEQNDVRPFVRVGNRWIPVGDLKKYSIVFSFFDVEIILLVSMAKHL